MVLCNELVPPFASQAGSFGPFCTSMLYVHPTIRNCTLAFVISLSCNLKLRGTVGAPKAQKGKGKLIKNVSIFYYPTEFWK
jgi:hypothetical protein